MHRKVTKVPESVMKVLENYNWPGNVRELENRLTAAVVRSPGEVLEIDIPETKDTSFSASSEWEWNRPLEDVEKFHIQMVLQNVDGHFGRACDILGILRPTLRKKISDYSLKASFKDE